jgi:ferritin-like metal-binding protein YciE
MKPKTFALMTPAAKRKLSSKSSPVTLVDIFEALLKDMYSAEKFSIRALPKMVSASHNEALREVFEDHFEQTARHINRIEKCFEMLEIQEAVDRRCEAMEGLVKEGTDVIEGYEKGHARDAALIAATQKMEHYEISTYGTLITMANVLGMMQVAQLLEETKDEEAETDGQLTVVAQRINRMAAGKEVVEGNLRVLRFTEGNEQRAAL